ncbi:MAG: 1-deoxy-D-xylulose-5-phosphate reductoisomerase [Candidatus Sulfobium sp.]|jgi:1-deoxy-D-xylulose-5-phosphate reductoisomerase
MKRLTILGSTGSIGRSALDIVARHGEDFRVVGLTAGKNIDLFERQIRLFKPEIVAVADKKDADRLRKRVGGPDIDFGVEGIRRVASCGNSDLVISAIVGAAGLIPTIAAIEAGRNVGLANKEALVMAGEIVMKKARRNKVKIIPVDSEHSAVFQCLEGRRPGDIKRIILTASGGPFLNKRKKDLQYITVKDALKHPNWRMGKKISIDSATLMNKGLEVIEAFWLFNLPPEKIDVVVHPQSIIHSLIEFKDRSCLAQMSMPDMKGPISYALAYPRRLEGPIEGLELHSLKSLTFSRPDNRNFPCLSYAYDALRAGGTMPCVLNAANEVAVSAFLRGSIRFNDIPYIIKRVSGLHRTTSAASLEEVLAADRWAREASQRCVEGLLN